MVRVVVFLSMMVVSVGCGRAAQVPSVSRPRSPLFEPTLGICADGPTAGARSASELVESVSDALQRGCPREAMLDALAAREAGAPGELVEVLLLESSERASAGRLLGVGAQVGPIGLLPDEAWFNEWVNSFDLETFERRFEALLNRIESGAISTGVRDDGRLARAIIRLELLPCATLPKLTNIQQIADQNQKMLIIMFNRFEKQILPSDPARLSETLAMSALWNCDFRGAASNYEDVARLESRPAAALNARLAAWELRHLTDGIGGYRFDSGSDRTRRALEVEAAHHDAGPSIHAGREALTALDMLLANARPTMSQAAWIAWARAVLALERLASPEDALHFAEQAQELAIRARRADILDGARVVAALAASERGEIDDARRLLIDAFGSIKRRGALGVRAFVVMMMMHRGQDLLARGKFDEALRLATAVHDGLVRSRPTLAELYATQTARTLETMGRLEDALEELKALSAEMAQNPDQAPVREVIMNEVAQQQDRLTLEIGGFDSVPQLLAERADTDQESAEAVLGSFLLRGDLASLREFLLKPRLPNDYLLLAQLICAARPGELIASGDRAVNDARERKTPEQQGSDDGINGSRVLAEFRNHHAALALMKCAAELQDRDMFDVAREMEPDDPIARPFEMIMNRNVADAAAWFIQAMQDWFVTVDPRGAMSDATKAGSMLTLAAEALLAASPPRVAQAVELLEQGRARDLRRSRVLRSSAEGDSRFAKVIAIEQQLAKTATKLQALRARASTPEALEADAEYQRGKRELEELSAQRDRAEHEVLAIDPAAYRAAALAPPPPMRELQTRLGGDEVMVYYVIDTLQAWAVVVDRKDLRAIQLSALDGDRLPRLRGLLFAHRAAAKAGAAARGVAVVAQAPDPLPELRRELYDLLVLPLESVIPPGRRVLIVPDLNTADLPFATLGPPDRPWIVRNPLRLLPGGYLLTDHEPARRGPEHALVVGVSHFSVPPAQLSTRGNEGEAWSELPHTRDEAIAVARVLGAKAILGDEANEAQIKREMVGATTIHFATHGKADVARPTSSFLVLSLRNHGDGEDGFLHAYEIERMHLAARLVVLSACETGKGVARGNEGVMALDRAFLVAGAGAVISSLWTVPDEATAVLMTSLHGELAKGRPADIALGEAMAAVRRQPRWSDPLIWGAFRLVGAGLR